MVFKNYLTFFSSMILILPLIHGCLFRKFFSEGSENDTTPSSNKDSFELDKDTISVVQQTLVKTLIAMDKLNFKCPQENGVFTDILDCRTFYICMNHTFSVERCEPGTGYEPLAKTCIAAESVPLCQKIQRLEDYKCNGTGLFTLEGHCEKFILCTKDASYASSCNRGDLFDPKFKLCLPENEVNCTSADNITKIIVGLDTSEYENEIHSQ